MEKSENIDSQIRAMKIQMATWFFRDGLSVLDNIFDRMPEVMFYVKNSKGRNFPMSQATAHYSGK